MLVPHGRDDAELGEGWGAADQRDEPRIFVRLEAMRDSERFAQDLVLSVRALECE
jgi:hypothetical protein